MYSTVNLSLLPQLSHRNLARLRIFPLRRLYSALFFFTSGSSVANMAINKKKAPRHWGLGARG